MLDDVVQRRAEMRHGCRGKRRLQRRGFGSWVIRSEGKGGVEIMEEYSGTPGVERAPVVEISRRLDASRKQVFTARKAYTATDSHRLLFAANYNGQTREYPPPRLGTDNWQIG